jgi:hypothetical protein
LASASYCVARSGAPHSVPKQRRRRERKSHQSHSRGQLAMFMPQRARAKGVTGQSVPGWLVGGGRAPGAWASHPHPFYHTRPQPCAAPARRAAPRARHGAHSHTKRESPSRTSITTINPNPRSPPVPINKTHCAVCAPPRNVCQCHQICRILVLAPIHWAGKPSHR